MSEELFQTVLVYTTIPAFVGVLFVLLYLITRYHFHVSLFEEAKQVLKGSIKKKAQTSAFSPAIYLLTFLLFVVIVVLAWIAEKSKAK